MAIGILGSRMMKGGGHVILAVGCRREGEVDDVVGGFEPPPGAARWEQSPFIATDKRLKDYLSPRRLRELLLDPEKPWPTGYRLSDTPSKR